MSGTVLKGKEKHSLYCQNEKMFLNGFIAFGWIFGSQDSILRSIELTVRDRFSALSRTYIMFFCNFDTERIINQTASEC